MLFSIFCKTHWLRRVLHANKNKHKQITTRWLCFTETILRHAPQAVHIFVARKAKECQQNVVARINSLADGISFCSVTITKHHDFIHVAKYIRACYQCVWYSCHICNSSKFQLCHETRLSSLHMVHHFGSLCACACFGNEHFASTGTTRAILYIYQFNSSNILEFILVILFGLG